MKTAYYHSPVGWLEIKGSEKGIASINFLDDNPPIPATVDTTILKQCTKQLDEYFDRKRIIFKLKLDIEGTDFQKKVWSELLKIPFGKTSTYLDMARTLGNKMALRAVGNANGKNPIPIIIPCHRVIGSDGKLVGFGGGLWRKKWLLDFENPKKQKELF
jgi:methylated-DNA-[protein]-cysteine S-methyltransferase